MKRTIGKIFKWLIILVIIGGLGFSGYTLYQKYYGASDATATSAYTPVTVTTGNLNQEVISTGSLSIADTETIKAPYSVTIESVAVKAGQTVAAGDVLAKVDSSSLDSAIAVLNTSLASVDSTLATLANSYSSSQSVTNPVEGRVKVIYGKVGDNVQDVVAENGCLYVLSLDGKMKVEVPADQYLSMNDTVIVTNGDKKWTGTVVKIMDGTATVTFSDASAVPGTEMRVMYNGVLLGTGKCEINLPLSVSTTLDGYISAAAIQQNYTFSKRASMYTVTNVATTQEFADAQQQRQDIIDELTLLRGLKNDPSIYATYAGIVSEINISRNTAVAKDSPMFTMYVGDPTQMVISVDELDIINLSVGQSATVEMDAISDKTYQATVEYISQIGSTSSGITSYSVTVNVAGDSQLKLGMNGTVTISVGQQNNVLLVPLTALQSDSQGSYVWLYSDTYQATEEAPGVKTYVTTGLSNEDYAAVTSGLQAGAQVLVVRSAASAATATTTTELGGMGMMDMGGGAMPAGGSAPTGTGTKDGTTNKSNRGTGGGSAPSGGFPGN